MTLILYIAFYHFFTDSVIIVLYHNILLYGSKNYESRTGNNRVQIINFIDSYLYIPIHYWYDRYMDMDR